MVLFRDELTTFIYHLTKLVMFNFLRSRSAEQPIRPTTEQVLAGTIVDVRTTSEFARDHVEGSINIPLSEVESQLAKFHQMKQPVITCCRSGNRSGIAAAQLKSHGIQAINGGPWNTLPRSK